MIRRFIRTRAIAIGLGVALVLLARVNLIHAQASNEPFTTPKDPYSPPEIISKNGELHLKGDNVVMDINGLPAPADFFSILQRVESAHSLIEALTTRLNDAEAEISSLKAEKQTLEGQVSTLLTFVDNAASTCQAGHVMVGAGADGKPLCEDAVTSQEVDSAIDAARVTEADINSLISTYVDANDLVSEGQVADMIDAGNFATETQVAALPTSQVVDSKITAAIDDYEPDLSSITGTVVANFRSDFASTPRRGWSYLYNDEGVHDVENFKPLKWAGGFFDLDGVNNGCGDPPPFGCLRITSSGGHPGAFDSNAGHSKFTIFGYEFQADGIFSIVRSLVHTPSDESNGVEVRVLLNGKLLINTHSRHTAHFNTAIGPAKKGDKLYVAIGPRGGSSYDSFGLDMSILQHAESSVLAQVLTGLGHIQLADQREFEDDDCDESTNGIIRTLPTSDNVDICRHGIWQSLQGAGLGNLGGSQANPAPSCGHIRRTGGESGMYWIVGSDGKPVEVYCFLERSSAWAVRVFASTGTIASSASYRAFCRARSMGWAGRGLSEEDGPDGWLATKMFMFRTNYVLRQQNYPNTGQQMAMPLFRTPTPDGWCMRPVCEGCEVGGYNCAVLPPNREGDWCHQTDRGYTGQQQCGYWYENGWNNGDINQYPDPEDYSGSARHFACTFKSDV